MMRIITGTARGIRLNTLEGERTRPTAERTKEAMFSIIQFNIEGRRVLDLFGGSGQLGLEAVSRGASHAVIVDQAKEAIRVIERNVEKTRLGDNTTVVCAEFADFIRSRRGRDAFDLVFLDPPYDMHAIPAAVDALLNARLLKPGAIVVCESAEPSPLGTGTALASKFEVVKEAKYGKAYVTVLALTNQA